MTPGDIPCNAPCEARWCRYNDCGMCGDNAPCDAQVEEGGAR